MVSRLSRPGWYWLSLVRLIASRPGGMGRALSWLLMYAIARIVAVRRIVRSFARRQPHPVAGCSESMFDTDVVEVVKSLRRDGFDSRLRLPAPLVRGLACLGGRVSTSSPYSGAEVSSSSAVERVAKDSTLLQIAALYLGTVPVYQGSRLWWTRSEALADPRETGAWFHYDLYDYGALVFLFYLTDVDPDSGPHVCVRASHGSRKWTDQLHPRRYRTDEEIVRSYGTERIITICGPAGTAIAEDPFCFHKVMLPTKGARLALQLLYTYNDFPAPSFNGGERSRQNAGSRARDRG